MAGSSSNGDEDMISGINVTPLVDVVLVLLIILMVTAQYAADKDSTIPMELPKAASGETSVVPSTLSVSIDKDGKFYLDAVEVSQDQLRERVKAAHAKDPETRAVIAADGRVHHSLVVKAIDILRQEKVTKFAINVRPEDLVGSDK